MWMESTNRVYGRTNNPYDASRIAGGSSGGEAAIIAAGGSPFGVGSDIGGSIRGPAFFNGIFGHKPTGGLVPNTGQYPSVAGRILTTGPLARRAADLMPLLRIMAGPDDQDGACEARVLGDPDAVDLRGLKLLHVEDSGFRFRSGDDLRDRAGAAAVARTRGAWNERRDRSDPRLAAAIRDMDGSDGRGARCSIRYNAGGGGADFRGARASEMDARAVGSHRDVAGRSDGGSARGVFSEEAAPIDPTEGRALRAELVARIGPRGVMLYPTYATPAPKHHVPFGDALRLRFAVRAPGHHERDGVSGHPGAARIERERVAAGVPGGGCARKRSRDHRGGDEARGDLRWVGDAAGLSLSAVSLAPGGY